MNFFLTMPVSLHSGRLTLSHTTDKVVILLDHPALPSLSLVANGFISYPLYLLMLFEVIFQAAIKETAEKTPTSDSCSISNLFACFSFFNYCLALICLFLL